MSKEWSICKFLSEKMLLHCLLRKMNLKIIRLLINETYTHLDRQIKLFKIHIFFMLIFKLCFLLY